jgi:hypothetical protein
MCQRRTYAKSWRTRTKNFKGTRNSSKFEVVTEWVGTTRYLSIHFLLFLRLPILHFTCQWFCFCFRQHYFANSILQFWLLNCFVLFLKGIFVSKDGRQRTAFEILSRADVSYKHLQQVLSNSWIETLKSTNETHIPSLK